MRKIAAIARCLEYSPGTAGKDRAILLAVAEELRQEGCLVEIIEHPDTDIPADTDTILHMARSEAMLNRLSECEQRGINVVNPVKGVRNCSRRKFMQLLHTAGISQPFFTIAKSNECAPHSGYPLWIKKSEGWACHPNDVCHAADRDQANAAIEQFRRRGIEEIIICSHIAGDIIKFYGIANGFFRHYIPDICNSKFGLEQFNGTPRHTPFDTDRLRDSAFKAAKCIGTDIFGGDAIVTPQGDIYIIDMNDFPSFSACRKDAARAIARHILTMQ